MLNKTAYDYNKKVFHERYNIYNKYELHHTMGRAGVALCCLHLFHPANHGHHDEINFIKYLRNKYREDLWLARKNFDSVLGCKEKIFPECNDCYFFKDLTKE